MSNALYSGFATTCGIFRNGEKMEAKLNFITPAPVSPSVGQKLPAAKKVDAKEPTSDFSQILTGQMFKAQQQGLTESQSANAGLQVVPLGETMSVITSNAAVPDVTTMANFARSQGFEESTFKSLFGSKPSS